jgi:steroid 5-alpha reductase family enzyme
MDHRLMGMAFLHTALMILAYVNIVFIIGLIRKRNDVADIAWGLGFIIVAASFYWMLHVAVSTKILYLMVAIWGLRLTLHLYRRNKGKTEDFRYKAWRHEWGKKVVLRSWLQVYLLQGFFMWVICLPIVYAPYGCGDLSIWQLPGAIIWLTGLLIESIADEQLLRFSRTKKTKGEFIQKGLWKYSRHPNYFGEILVWWGIFAFIIPCHNSWPAVISPITITLLLRYVSGVPMLEKKYEGNESYKVYKEKTSMLIPWKSKK